MCSLVLCIAELLVHKGLCKRVVITRLPVGHTHEDIDSLFAKIWMKLRLQHVMTPQQFELMVRSALYKKGCPVVVKDIFAVPDFQSFVGDACCDQLFGRWKQMQWTQLQFTVEEAPEGTESEFPLGVRTTYRSYCADSVIELEPDPDPDALVPFIPVQVEVLTHPLPSLQRRSGGLYLLKRVPTDPIIAGEFIKGSSAHLKKVLAKVKSSFAFSHPRYLEEWLTWAETAPTSDSVKEYLAQEGRSLHVPLYDQVFKDLPVDLNCEIKPLSRNQKKKKRYKQVQTTDAVQWAGNGGKKYNVPPRREVCVMRVVYRLQCSVFCNVYECSGGMFVYDNFIIIRWETTLMLSLHVFLD
jgi:hypothetical protein